jgi:predicted N-acetyltransferase YhbS
MEQTEGYLTFAVSKMSTNMSIRSATVADEKEIKKLLKATTGVWQTWWRETAVAKALQSADTMALVALREDRIVGFACFHDVGFRAYLSEMVVRKSEQGSGIGSKLLREAETMLASKGCQLIVADVYPPAEGFYIKNGWAKPKAILMSKVTKKKFGEPPPAPRTRSPERRKEP